MTYIEQNCCIEHEGKHYCAGGAVVTPDFIVAYPSESGVLKDWHGNALGTWRATASWPVRSYFGARMYQIEARVNGQLYTGRGFGEGMIYKGKRKRS